MKFLITGVAGFIGTNLRRELEDRDHEVVGIDFAPDERTEHANDLLEPGVFRSIAQEERPDIVVHLAAQVGRLFGEDDVVRAVRSNAEMTTIVAKTCGDLHMRLAYASTSEVYGDHGDVVCDEVDGPWVLPHNLYGLSKRWGEEVCGLYAPDKLTIFRPSMPYGPGAPPGRGRRALDNMLWQAHHRMPIPVHRHAERSWCWVGDAVRAMRLLLERPYGGAFNVGRDDDPRSMYHVAQMACALTQAPFELIEEIEPPQRQTVVKRLSTQRLREIGWEPTVELEEGMREVLAWVRKFDNKGRRIEW